MTDKNSNHEKANSLISAGAEISGAAVGGALGFLAAGPSGAATFGAVGAICGQIIEHVGSEIYSRYLGPREKVRVGGALAIAANEIQERLKKGDKLRSDGFLTPTIHLGLTLKK